MKKVAIISQKGGTGKTTLAVNLAIASEFSNHKTVVFDLDPQASSSDWHDQRSMARPKVVSLHAARLAHYLGDAQAQGVEMIFFDTAPHAQKDALDAVHVSDLILIPCRASLMDLRAIRTNQQIATIANKPATVVLTQVPPTGTLKEDAIKAIKYYQLEVAPVAIGYRAIFVHSFAMGKGVLELDRSSKGSQEIEALFSFLKQKLEVHEKKT